MKNIYSKNKTLDRKDFDYLGKIMIKLVTRQKRWLRIPNALRVKIT